MTLKGVLAFTMIAMVGLGVHLPNLGPAASGGLSLSWPAWDRRRNHAAWDTYHPIGSEPGAFAEFAIVFLRAAPQQEAAMPAYT